MGSQRGSTSITQTQINRMKQAIETYKNPFDPGNKIRIPILVRSKKKSTERAKNPNPPKTASSKPKQGTKPGKS